MRERLLESERRAAAADEALRQIREERDERLEQAREALARERSARVAAEQRLAEVIETEAPPEVQEPLEVLEPVEPEPAGYEDDNPDPGQGFPEGGDRQLDEPAPENGQEEGWPAPWLEEEKPQRRGLFRRSRS